MRRSLPRLTSSRTATASTRAASSRSPPAWSPLAWGPGDVGIGGPIVLRQGLLRQANLQETSENLEHDVQLTYGHVMGMRIGELARRTGVEAGTLRAWERRFALLTPTRTDGGQRQYSATDVERVLAVRRLMDEGLTLAPATRRVLGPGDDALTTSEAETLLLHQLVQNLDQGILVGKDARTRYANRRAAQILGCSVDELHTRSILDFIPPDGLSDARDKMSQFRQGVAPEPSDPPIVRADGSALVIEAHVRPLFDRAG